MLAPWEKSYDQPRQHIKKQRHYLVSKCPYSQTMFFPIIMYGCENWTIKKAEYQRIDAFKLECWWRLLRIPWTSRRSNQLVLKEINLNIHWQNWCWSWSSSTLATWCEESTHEKRPWFWERLKAKGEGRRQRIRRLDSVTDSLDMNLSKFLEIMNDRETCLSVVHGVTKGHDLATV